MNNSDEVEQLYSAEATHTWQRIVELRLDPVRGKFDAAHLKEINRRIFQDLPGYGYDHIRPGEYRDPVSDGNDWVKTRLLETVGVRSTVAYSSMDKAAQHQLDRALIAADPSALSKLSTDDFVTAIGSIYSQVDHIHPFPDGNSRTLREFTRQLAEESGYKLDWERFNQTPAGRDILYIARDLSVIEHCLPFIQDEGTKREVLRTMDQFEGNRDLPALLQDVVEPLYEPSLDEQIKQQSAAPALVKQSLETGEPSLEEQLKQYETGTYVVKVAATKPVESEQVLREAYDDEPGMDI
jgi:cell filamentation protein